MRQARHTWGGLESSATGRGQRYASGTHTQALCKQGASFGARREKSFFTCHKGSPAKGFRQLVLGERFLLTGALKVR